MREILSDLVAEEQSLDQFLQRIHERDWKLRRFLLLTLKRFIANWEAFRHAQKRGGGNVHIPIGGSRFEVADEPSVLVARTVTLWLVCVS